jgi:ABC-2 type transport system permease protein
VGALATDGGRVNLRKAFAIAGVNLRRLTRDKTGAFFVFVFPFLIILALGAAFGAGFVPQVGVVSGGSGALGQDLRARLAATEGIDVRSYRDVDELRTAVERGLIEGGIVIPAGYDERVREGETVPITAIIRPTGSAQELKATMSGVLDQQSVRIRAARFAITEGVAGSFDDALARADSVEAALPGIEVTTRTAGSEPPARSTRGRRRSSSCSCYSRRCPPRRC